ncbi:MAG: hypothetical protein ACOCU6_01860, partial [Nanoarchaeota archaeon]
NYEKNNKTYEYKRAMMKLSPIEFSHKTTPEKRREQKPRPPSNTSYRKEPALLKNCGLTNICTPQIPTHQTHTII